MLSTKCLEIIYLIYMYKKDLALNNLQWVICHKTKQNQSKYLFRNVRFSVCIKRIYY